MQSALSLLIKFETALLTEERVPLNTDKYHRPPLSENPKPITNKYPLYADVSV